MINMFNSEKKKSFDAMEWSYKWLSHTVRMYIAWKCTVNVQVWKQVLHYVQ